MKRPKWYVNKAGGGVASEGYRICECFGPHEVEHAAFIVLACNNHDALVEALRDTVESLCRVDCGCCEEPTHGHTPICKNAREVLARVEEDGRGL